MVSETGLERGSKQVGWSVFWWRSFGVKDPELQQKGHPKLHLSASTNVVEPVEVVIGISTSMQQKCAGLLLMAGISGVVPDNKGWDHGRLGNVGTRQHCELSGARSRTEAAFSLLNIYDREKLVYRLTLALVSSCRDTSWR
jgi:hypothetical protein